MRILARGLIPLLAQRGAWVVAAAVLASACTTSGTRRPERTETRDETGFTISEDVRVGGDVSANFESALRSLRQGENDAGIALLRQVTEAAPHVTTPHIDLGIAYRRLDDMEPAEDSLKTALELNPSHPVAHNELGILYRKTGRFDKARESYEKALAAYPDFHFARRNLAILCDMYLADLGCAVEQYELYIQAVPDDEAAAMWIADLRSRIDR